MSGCLHGRQMLNCKPVSLIYVVWLQVSEPEVLAFRGRRTGTSHVRRKLATNAVMQNYKPPPTAPTDVTTKGVPVQRTINELFQRQTASALVDNVDDMQLV